jgi:hypothetical protein
MLVVFVTLKNVALRWHFQVTFTLGVSNIRLLISLKKFDLDTIGDT